MNEAAKLAALVAALEAIVKECGTLAITDEPTGVIETVSYVARNALASARVAA